MMSELTAAYQATTYRIFLGAERCDLRIGLAAEKLRCWLETTGMLTFVLLTAHNPASRCLPEPENDLRQARLEADLLTLNYRFLAAENRPDDGNWPLETACCVMGMSLDVALELGRRHGQNAIVFGGVDGIPHLYWIEKKNNG